MPLPVIADVFRCALTWSDSGVATQAVNVLHVRATSATPEEIAGFLDDDMPNNMLLNIASSAHALTVDITALDGVTPGARFNLANWDGQNDNASPMVAVAQLISFRTAIRGPRGRGRIFLPFPSENAYTSGMMNALNCSQMHTAWVSYINALAISGVELGVASYAHADFHPVTDLTVEIPAATMKRRQDRLR
jgi:hypothetical protein